MKGNKLIKILAIVFVAIVLIVLMINGKSKNKELVQAQNAPALDDNGLALAPVSDDELAKEFGVDVDSPEETMRTLTTELQAVKRENDLIQQENERLRQEAEKLLNMEKNITSRVDGKVRNAEIVVENQAKRLERQSQESDTLLRRLEQRLKDLELSRNEPKTTAQTTPEGYDIGMAGIPDGLGYTDGGMSGTGVIWKQPLDAVKDEKSGALTLPDFSLPDLGVQAPGIPEGEELRRGKKKDEPTKIKAYTIPENATLFGSTSMTALLGRIPVDGQISDPYPFKIIVGPENLSSNGINIPNVEGITMSGVAKGDWTLSCVSGEIHSMTFTFSDGSISTYPEPKEGGTARRETIAWFSDEYGVPCVTGKRITNAPSYLATRIGLGALSAYANVQAQQEYTNTTTSGPYGTSTSSTLTGDAGNAAKNQAIVGGTEEVLDWVEKRQQQSFDAIYVEPGTKLHLHMIQQVAIDYPINGTGRKVQHSEFTNFQSNNMHRGLD